MYRDEDVDDEYMEDVECFFCGDPLNEEDEHDSSLTGTLPRCRSHILSVAPELLTADTIATRRGA